jgi:hypothetical protein
MVNRTRRPHFFYTAVGFVVSVAAVAIWIGTFSPHGGVELSGYLFPGARWICEFLYPQESVPALVFYGSALLHWPFVGFVVDVVQIIVGSRGEDH